MAYDESRIDEIKSQVESEVKQVIIESEVNGIVLKADTLGSLEAILEMLKSRQISRSSERTLDRFLAGILSRHLL